MKIGAIVQARMNSQRLPQKALRNVSGKPLLQYILERLEKASKLDAVVVATSSESSDDPIAEFCERNRTAYYRGSLHHVADRFKEVAKAFSLTAFVRVSGDSPLLDQELVDQAIRIFQKGDCDLVTNILTRSYPKGQSVEVCRTETFIKTLPKFTTEEDQEHVTKYFYKNANQFKISSFEFEQDQSGLQLSVDTPADLQIVSSIFSLMTRPHWEYRLNETLKLHQQALIASAPIGT